METIRRTLAAGRRFLVIELVTGDARLMKQSEVFRRSGGPGWVKFAVVDLQVILDRFEKEAPPRDAFTLSEVAVMAQEKGPTVNSWIKADVLTPSIRNRNGTQGRAMLFNRHDAFVACLVASLKRQCGLPLSKLRDVSDVLSRQGHDGGNLGEVARRSRRSTKQQSKKSKEKASCNE